MNQREQYKRIIKFSSSVLVIAIQVWLYWQVWMRYYSSNIELPFFRKGNWLMAALYGAMLLFFVHTYGGLKVGYLRKGDLIYSQMLGTVFVNAVTYVQICLLDRHFVNAVPLLLMSVGQGIVFFLWANLFQWIYSQLFPPRRMILVYGDRPAFGLKRKISTREDKYNICATVDIRKGMECVCEEIRGRDHR